jgi:hypothetical protein
VVKKALLGQVGQRVEHAECMHPLQFVAILRRSPHPSRLSTTGVEALRRAHA